MDNFEKFLITMLLVLVAAMGYSLFASNICASNNYPRSYVVLPFEIKCGRIVNQTEYVCSLKEIESNNCFPTE